MKGHQDFESTPSSGSLNVDWSTPGNLVFMSDDGKVTPGRHMNMPADGRHDYEAYPSEITLAVKEVAELAIFLVAWLGSRATEIDGNTS